MSKKPLGLVSLVCLVIGNMIGSGVYISSFFSLSSIHDARYVLWIWLIAGVHAICGAIAYAAVSKRLPVSGGEYAILSRWGHPLLGFMAGWISIVAGFAAPIALAAAVFAEYGTIVLFNGKSSSLWSFWLSAGSIATAAMLHAIGVSVNAWVNNTIVAMKMICLTLFLVIGLVWVANHNESGILHTPSTIEGEGENSITHEAPRETSDVPTGLALVWTMMGSLYFTTLAYTGFNASIYLAGEFSRTRDVSESEPSGTGQSIEGNTTTDAVVGRSMIVACVLVTIFYLLLNYVFLYSIPATEIIAAEVRFVGTVALAIGGEACRSMMIWVIILSSLTSVLAMTMTGPYVYLQMFQDYGLKRWIPQERVQTLMAIGIQTVLALCVVGFGTLRSTLAYLGLTLTACGALAIATLWFASLRNKGPNKEWLPMRWWEHLGAIIYVGMAAFLFVVASLMIPIQFFWCMATIGIGLLVYMIGSIWGTVSRS